MGGNLNTSIHKSKPRVNLILKGEGDVNLKNNYKQVLVYE